jgi:hypothetical protein
LNFERNRLSNTKTLNGGEEELVYSLANYCPLTKPPQTKP